MAIRLSFFNVTIAVSWMSMMLSISQENRNNEEFYGNKTK